jgi:hypothetical protein
MKLFGRKQTTQTPAATMAIVPIGPLTAEGNALLNALNTGIKGDMLTYAIKKSNEEVARRNHA